MAFRIDRTETALSDLLEPVRYIAEDNPEAAQRFGNPIVDRIEGIAEFPFSARKVPEDNDENIRELILRPHRLVLEIDSNLQVVYVLRIWHSSRGTAIIR